MPEDYGVSVTAQTVNDLRHKFVDPLYAGDEAIVPMAAGTVIAAGQFVCANSSGYAVVGADSAGYTFLGVALEDKDNSAGENGDLQIRIRRRGCFLMAAHSISQADVGKTMYIRGAATFDESASNNIVCGRLVNYVSGTQGWLSIDEAVYAPASPLSADSLTVSDPGDHFAAAESTVPAQIQKLAKTIPLNFYCETISASASDQVIVDDFELPIPVKVKRAYATLQTAPGSEKTLTIEIAVGAGSDVTLCTVTGTNKKGENESLNIDIAANTKFDIKLTQDGGSAAGLQLMLIAQVDDGE